MRRLCRRRSSLSEGVSVGVGAAGQRCSRRRPRGRVVLRGWPSRTFTRAACAATARVLSQYALLQISGSVWILRVASRRHPNMNPTVAGSVWILGVARGDTQRQIRPGPTSAPTISALFAASNVFDRTLLPDVVGLGRGRTSTCSMTSFAIHGTVTELDLQRRIRLFPIKSR